MQFILLWGEADFLRLPGFDASTLPYLVYFLLFIIGMMLFLQWRLRRENQKNALSNRFMQVVMHRGLTKNQLQWANDFFKNLKEAQQNEILLSQKSLAHYLHQYLRQHEMITANDRVEIFDKVLPGMTSQIEIKSVSDLRPGEPCAIDVNKKSHLASILKIKDDQMLLSLTEKILLPLGDAKIYAYRPQLGGFLLSGKITKVNGPSLIFRHDGPIEFRGDQHLMSIIEVRVKLERWPHPEMNVESAEPDPEKAPEYFYAETQRISDRAMSIRFTEPPPPWVLRKQEYWEMTLELEEPITCRVRVNPYRPPELWLMRPVDMSETDRARLYKFISTHEPQREHF